jgi:hypothetical protein
MKKRFFHQSIQNHFHFRSLSYASNIPMNILSLSHVRKCCLEQWRRSDPDLHKYSFFIDNKWCHFIIPSLFTYIIFHLRQLYAKLAFVVAQFIIGTIHPLLNWKKVNSQITSEHGKKMLAHIEAHLSNIFSSNFYPNLTSK